MFDSLSDSAFLFIGAFALIFVVFVLFANAYDKPFLIFIGFGFGVVLLLVSCIYFPHLVYRSCPFCGSFPECGVFCSNCGADLIDDCVCGHVWTNKEVYCPECGAVR